MSAAVIAGSTIPLVLGAAGAAIQLTRFCRFDRKPTIASGDFDAAAMIHDARRVLHIESIYLGEGRTR